MSLSVETCSAGRREATTPRRSSSGEITHTDPEAERVDPGRRHVVEEAAVLVVGEQVRGVVVLRRGAERGDDLLLPEHSDRDVLGRVLVEAVALAR
jgi:hypothetical protein